MIKAENIRSVKHVKQILDDLGEYIRAYEIQIGDLPEEVLSDIHFQLCEIDEFIIGEQNCNDNNIFCADFRMMSYYRYISKECSFDELMKTLRKYEGEV